MLYVVNSYVLYRLVYLLPQFVGSIVRHSRAPSQSRQETKTPNPRHKCLKNVIPKDTRL